MAKRKSKIQKGELSLREFSVEYLKCLKSFTNSLPLLVDSEQVATNLHILGGRLYNANEKLIYLGLEMGNAENPASRAMELTLEKANNLLKVIDNRFILNKPIAHKEFSDIEYYKNFEKYSDEELDDFLNLLSRDEESLYYNTQNDFPKEYPPIFSPNISLIAAFQYQEIAFLMPNLKLLLIPIMIQLLRQLGVDVVSIPDVNAQVNHAIDGAISLWNRERSEKVCKVEVLLEKLTLSSNNIGTNFIVDFEIGGSAKRVPEEDEIDDWTEKGGGYERNYEPPLLLAKLDFEGCDEHPINISMQGTENEITEMVDTDKRDIQFKHKCDTGEQKEKIALTINENEGTAHSDPTVAATLTAYLIIKSNCDDKD